MGAQKPIRFPSGDERATRQKPQGEPLPSLDRAQPAKRQIGDLRVREDIAAVIGAALPEGVQLVPDRVTLCTVPIQFHCIVTGTAYVALLFIDDGYVELTYPSWFLSALCLRIFSKNGSRLDGPVIEIIATQSGLLPEDWRDELDACMKARLVRSSTRITRIAPWLAEGLEGSRQLVETWVKEMRLERGDGQNDRGDSFGPISKASSGDERAKALSHTDVEQAKRRKGPLVFVSYAHDDADKNFFKDLMDVLKTFEDDEEYKSQVDADMTGRRQVVWTDAEIRENGTGEEWQTLIQDAWESARVVVAVVTNRYFVSDFIKSEELKPTLDAVKKQQQKFAWVPAGDTRFETYGLGRLQAAWDVDQPLNTLDEGKREQAVKKIAERIGRMLDTSLKIFRITGP